MNEILGNNLKKFFDTIDSECKNADITYAGNEYEVWNISDDLFTKMLNMSEDEFIELAGEDAWCRSCAGSNLGVPLAKAIINGHFLICWNYGYEEEFCKEFKSLTEYLCECVGASNESNVCACVVDLANYNNMSMAELFRKYEG